MRLRGHERQIVQVLAHPHSDPEAHIHRHRVALDPAARAAEGHELLLGLRWCHRGHAGHREPELPAIAIHIGAVDAAARAPADHSTCTRRPERHQRDESLLQTEKNQLKCDYLYEY